MRWFWVCGFFWVFFRLTELHGKPELLMFVGVFLKKQDQFVFRSKGISCGQLQICSLNISDCLAMETSMLLCFHDWLSYVPRA